MERVEALQKRLFPHRPTITPLFFNFSPHMASIHREVTPHGVRVYSLCAGCGAMLEMSATLCEDCAQKRSGQTRP